ncbi:MAG: hypothetical protein ACOX1T_06445 [Saccharofermentanales bacterium]|jgi:hypothetical protein
MKNKRLKSWRAWRGRRGSASALIVLLLVLLIFFGVLSLVTTAADNRLANRRAEWVSAYYAADQAAVNVVADLRRYQISQQTSQPAATRDATVKQLQGYLEQLANVEQLETGLEADSDLLFRCWHEDQAIEVGLSLAEQAAGANKPQLVINRWTAWQEPFDYDSDEGGVWKGELE